MNQYTVIPTSKEQAQELYDKHMKPETGLAGLFFNKKTVTTSKIRSFKFSYDSEDDIGFVILFTTTGKKIEYQLRGTEPMFVGFSGFGNIRYDVNYPHQIHQEMYDMLKLYGNQAKDNFWKGGQI